MFLLERRRDDFVNWLAVVTAAPLSVAVSVIPWASFAPILPSLTIGDIPESLEEPELIGPLQDALVLYMWKHIVDKYLSSPVAKAVAFFTTYLELIAPALPAISYLGYRAPPELFPNAAFHFPIHGGWPLKPDWLSEFQISQFVSPQAALWATSIVDIQSAGYEVPILQTLADQEAAEHLQRTPQLPESLKKAADRSKTPPSALKPSSSPLPSDPPQPSPKLSATERAMQKQLADMAANFAKQLAAMQVQLQSAPERKSDKTKKAPGATDIIDIDAEVTSPMKDLKFDPFHIVKQYSPAISSENPKDRHTLQSAKQALFAQEIMQTTKWSEVLTWSLQSSADRARSADEYKALSCLLVHESTPDHRTGVMHTLLIRAPCASFCKEFLLPVFTATGTTTHVDASLQYMRMVIYHQRITNFKQVYAESFFTSENLRNFLQLANWEMDDVFDPTTRSSSSWTTYHFLTCLSSQASTFDGKLPVNGISILEAKHLSLFVYSWFRAMDMKTPTGAASFDSSYLAQYLMLWKDLADHPMLHSLWQQAPRDITFWWFYTLREILLPFQLLAMSNRYSPNGGFTNDPRKLTIEASCGLGSAPFPQLLEDVRYRFQQRWSNARLTSARPFHVDVQDDHFRTVLVAPPRASTKVSIEKPGEKRSRDTDKPHFVASKPLFKLLGEPPRRPSAITGRFLQHITSAGAPMFRLSDKNGKSRQICLKSCCQHPWNQCVAVPCEHVKRQARDAPRVLREPAPYLHIDLSSPAWRDAPETTWAPIVAFLKKDGVSQTIQPSEWLKALTPSACW